MDLEERTRLHDEAIERAHQLRQAAIVQAWDWLLGRVFRPPASVERSRHRLARRLHRRSTTVETPACPS